MSVQSHELRLFLTKRKKKRKKSAGSSGERLIRGYTKFDITVDEGNERLNPSREKNYGKYRRRKVEESCGTLAGASSIPAFQSFTKTVSYFVPKQIHAVRRLYQLGATTRPLRSLLAARADKAGEGDSSTGQSGAPQGACVSRYISRGLFD